MELEIKHIAGYLPYGLKCLTSRHQIKYGQRHELLVNGLAIDVDGNLNIEFLYDDDLLFSNNLNTVKPILYPMSQIMAVEICHEDLRIIRDFGVSRIYDLTYRSICVLHEEHMDLHGLIGQGLAINKLELKQS